MSNTNLSQQVFNSPAELMERVLLTGDLSKLTPAERLHYYTVVCESIGLNPLTRPFEYIYLSGKLSLYAKKDCTDQLRNIHNVSITDLTREIVEGIYVVTAHAENKNTHRTDMSVGAVPIENIKGENRANAMMKAETKAKRRVTLSICGLGMLDESEIESIPGAIVPIDDSNAVQVIQSDNTVQISLTVEKVKAGVWDVRDNENRVVRVSVAGDSILCSCGTQTTKKKREFCIHMQAVLMPKDLKTEQPQVADAIAAPVNSPEGGAVDENGSVA